jgi:tetratricopeptide (TPR) repeat protein
MKSLFVTIFILFNILISISPIYSQNQKGNGYRIIAEKKFEFGKYSEAIRFYELAIKANPKDYLHYLGIANVYVKTQEFSKIVTNLNKSISLNPGKSSGEKFALSSSYFIRGLAKHNLNDLQGAIDDYTKCINLNPKDSEAYNLRGYAFFNINGKQKEACADWKKSLSLGFMESSEPLNKHCKN